MERQRRERGSTNEAEKTDHWGWRLAPIVLVAVALVKAYCVAHFSLTSTGALLTSAPLNVLLGSIAQYLYLILPLSTVGLFGTVAYFLSEKRHLAWCLPLLGSAFLLALLSPWVYLWPVTIGALVVTGLVFGLEFLLGRRDNNTSWERRRRWLSTVAAAAATATLLGGVLATMDLPWVPAEAVTLKNDVVVQPVEHIRSHVVVGYVLSEEAGGSAVILVETGRYILHVDSEQIVTRRICHGQHQLRGRRPLYYALSGRRYSSPNVACSRYLPRN